MMLLLACAPLVLAASILGFTRLPAWVAGAAAMMAALPALLLSIPEPVSVQAYVLDETLRGSWLAWQAISVMVTGLFFHAATQSCSSSDQMPTVLPDAAQLFTLVMFIGPFVESAVGFGVGIVVVLGYLRTRGVPPMAAALLSLLSQTLVPWGAFAVGTLIGSVIAGISLTHLATASAMLSIPLMLAWLPFYWRLTSQAGVPSLSKPSEAAWVLLAMLVLVLGNAFLDPQIALIAAFGMVIVLRQIFLHSFSVAKVRQQILSIWPYLLLCAVLLASRLIEPLGMGLQSLSRFEPYKDQTAFFPLYHPGFWLLTTGCLALLINRRSPGAVLGNTFSSAWRPVLVTLLFVIMARWMISAGSATAMAEVIANMLGPYAILTSPFLAAVAGFLTGSNAASNAMMMPMQSALVASSTVPVLFTAAIQNVSGSAMTALSPARIVFASTLAGGLDEREIYRRVGLFAAPPLLILVLLCALSMVVW